MTLTGSNWQPGESVHINVNDDQGKTWSRDVDVTADASGNITDQFQLPSTFVAVYKVTATGAQSGVAVTYFTDGNVRFTTSTSAVSFVATWERYSTNNCTGTKVSLPPPNTANSGSDTVQNAAGQSLTVVANTGNYVKLTAPLTEDGQTFTGWTATGNATFTTSGSNGETICAAGDDTGLSSFTANYTAADTTPPAAPSLDLNANSDTGSSSTDNTTKDNTPTFDGYAESGSTVKVYNVIDANTRTLLGSAVANGAVDPNNANNKAWSFTPSSALNDGTYTIKATATDAANNTSGDSSGLSVTIDTQVNAPTGLDLDAASDLGASSTDNLTKDNTPTINGTAEANGSVELFNGTTSLGTASADNTGAWSITSSTLTPDNTYALTAKATDVAGNVSDLSNPLSVTIDTAIATPAAPDLDGASDSGISNSDNVTNDSTPTFNGTAEAGSSVSVLVDGVEKGTGTASGGSYSITTSALSDGSRSVTVKATDVTGNVSVESNSLSVTIDTQAPVITFNVNNTTVNNNGQYYFGSVPSAPTCSASDALSGLDGSCSVGGYGTTVGSHTVTATANDKAGNTNSASITYSVLAWTLKGFYSPVDYDTATAKVWNTVKGGATVPLKFEVFAGSTELTDPAVVDRFTATGVVCPGANAATDDIEITTTGGTQLRYDATGGQFIQNWQTPKKPGSCYDVSMITDDGTKLPVARFMLK